jgi:hypothetical protein
MRRYLVLAITAVIVSATTAVLVRAQSTTSQARVIQSAADGRYQIVINPSGSCSIPRHAKFGSEAHFRMCQVAPTLGCIRNGSTTDRRWTPGLQRSPKVKLNYSSIRAGGGLFEFLVLGAMEPFQLLHRLRGVGVVHDVVRSALLGAHQLSTILGSIISTVNASDLRWS